MTQQHEFQLHEQHLHDKEHNLEICLADASQQIRDLQKKLTNSLRTTDNIQQYSDNLKRENFELTNELRTISNILLSGAGIQRDGSLILSDLSRTSEVMTLEKLPLLTSAAVKKGIQAIKELVNDQFQKKVGIDVVHY